MSDLFESFSDNLQVPLKSKRRMLNEFNDFCVFQIWSYMGVDLFPKMCLANI